MTNTSRKWAAVTPNDSTDIPGGTPRAIIVAVGGNLAAHNADGTVAGVITVPAGVIPIQPKRILSTGTTATGITALF